MDKTRESDSDIASTSEKGLEIGLGHLRKRDGDVREPSHNPTREQARGLDRGLPARFWFRGARLL
jgi:hypothetical protein